MGRPLRVAFLTSHPIQYQAPLFRALAADARIDLTVFFCSARGAETYMDRGFQTAIRWDVPLLEGYRHVMLRNWRRNGGSDSFAGLVNPGVLQRLRRSRFDALVVHGWAHATNWAAFLGASVAGIPFFVRGEANGLSEPTGFRNLAKRILLGGLFRRATAALAIGSLNRAFYVRYGLDASRIAIAPYAVDNAAFGKAARGLLAARTRLRVEYDVPPDATVFLFCGKLVEAKRPTDAVHALARLTAAKGSRPYLLMAGDGPLRVAVEREAAKLRLSNLRVLGFVNQSKLPSIYALSDALVLPSAFEPWGLVVNEALNLGLYVVATDRVGCGPDLLSDPRLGAIVPAADVSALAGAMQSFLSNGISREQRLEVATRLMTDWSVEAAAASIAHALTTRVRAVE